MIAVVQRVRNTALTADGVPFSSISHGYLVLLGVLDGDDENDARLLASKIVKLRICSDENGKMNLSLSDVSGELMIVSNFTLGAEYKHGNRPDFFRAASPEIAKRIYESFISFCRESGLRVECGLFGADMQISTTADGPVTIVMDSSVLRKEPRP